MQRFCFCSSSYIKFGTGNPKPFTCNRIDASWAINLCMYIFHSINMLKCVCKCMRAKLVCSQNLIIVFSRIKKITIEYFQQELYKHKHLCSYACTIFCEHFSQDQHHHSLFSRHFSHQTATAGWHEMDGWLGWMNAYLCMWNVFAGVLAPRMND